MDEGVRGQGDSDGMQQVRPHAPNARQYAVYDGDEYLYGGTAKEVAEYMGVEPSTVKFNATPAGRRRMLARKNARHIYIRVEDACDT